MKKRKHDSFYRRIGDAKCTATPDEWPYRCKETQNCPGNMQCFEGVCVCKNDDECPQEMVCTLKNQYSKIDFFIKTCTKQGERKENESNLRKIARRKKRIILGTSIPAGIIIFLALSFILYKYCIWVKLTQN